MQENDTHLPSLFRSVKVMMAASSFDYKDDGREEKKEPDRRGKQEGSKPVSRRALWMLTVLIIILFVVAVLCGVGAFVYTSHQINNLQKQINDSEHSCAQLKKGSIQIPWQHL